MEQIINKIKNGKIDTLTTENLEKIIRYASDKYYNLGENIFTDEQYDIIKELLKKKDPNNSYIKEIGAPVNEKDAVELPYWMGSLDKIRDDERTLEKWKNKYNGDYIISDKLDGNSGLLVYSNGKYNLYSRGNGYKGKILNNIIKYLNLPTIIDKKSIAIRGELIISKNNWEKIKNIGANARNVVAGLLHSKTPNPEIAKYVEFIVYELVSPKVKPSEGILELEKLGFNVVYHTKIEGKDNLNTMVLSNKLIERRDQSGYEIDGIVVEYDDKHKVISGKNPKYAFAFKSLLTHDEAEAIVSHIEWNVSKDGYIKPTVIIEPVYIQGVKISRVTGNNGSYIEKNRIGVGAKIVLIRSGDVIPKIVRVIKETEPQMPDIPYKWTEGHVDLQIIDATKEVSQQIVIRNLEHFCKTLEIKYVSTGIITKLVNNGINTIPKLLNITVKDLLKIEGFKDTSAEKVYKSIQETIDKIKTDKKVCIEFMSASNVFGRSLGTKKLQMIVEVYPRVINEDIDITVEDLIKIKGIAKITAEAFIEGKKKYHDLLKNIDIRCKIDKKKKKKEDTEEEIESNNKIPKGLGIVFTGFRNKEWETKIENAGSHVKTSISKNVNILVADNVKEKSSKIEKAKELGITIMTKNEFETKYIK